MSPLEPITVSVEVSCDPATAFAAFTEPASVMAWNFASPDWHCPHATNDVRVGGAFCYRREARDGSMGFDFEGTFLDVEPGALLRFGLGPERVVTVEFTPVVGGTAVRETFTPEDEHPLEMQRAGWQAILDNYRAHAESRAH